MDSLQLVSFLFFFELVSRDIVTNSFMLKFQNLSSERNIDRVDALQRMTCYAIVKIVKIHARLYVSVIKSARGKLAARLLFFSSLFHVTS